MQFLSWEVVVEINMLLLSTQCHVQKLILSNLTFSMNVQAQHSSPNTGALQSLRLVTIQHFLGNAGNSHFVRDTKTAQSAVHKYVNQPQAKPPR